MSEEQKWGAGDRRNYLGDETNQFQDGKPFRVFFGEHPHSRSDNDFYADLGEGQEPVAFDGHRVRTKIVIEEANYLKCSGLSGNEIRKQCWADIFMNDKLVFRCTGPREAPAMLLKARDVLGLLCEHSVQLWRPEWDGLIGHKIFYREHPAVVTDYYPEQGAAMIRSVDGDFPQSPHSDYLYGTTVKDDFLSPHIWWFRKEGGERERSAMKGRG